MNMYTETSTVLQPTLLARVAKILKGYDIGGYGDCLSADSNDLSAEGATWLLREALGDEVLALCIYEVIIDHADGFRREPSCYGILTRIEVGDRVDLDEQYRGRFSEAVRDANADMANLSHYAEIFAGEYNVDDVPALEEPMRQVLEKFGVAAAPTTRLAGFNLTEAVNLVKYVIDNATNHVELEGVQ